MLDMKTSVGVLAASHPRLRAVLEELGVDYCCSGNRTLADAAAAEGLPIQRVMEEIGRAPEAAGPHNVVWFDKSLVELMKHVSEHHRGLALEPLARAAVLFDIVAEEKLIDAEVLDPLRQTFQKFVNDLIPHIEREERIVFPAIEAVEEEWEHGTPPPPRFEGGLRAVLAPLYLEHDALNTALRQFRNGRVLLSCIDHRSCRQLAHRLRDIEHDLHEAMNLENFVLFPRAIALEDQLCNSTVMATV
jgi:regulator of cell morphogenesis and NO signaling